MASGAKRAAQRGRRILFAASGFFASAIGTASAADTANLDASSTAWVITASALVLFMTLPGLALFYGGLVRSRNLLSVLMHCFAITCIVSVLWMAFGYSLAFAPGNALIGSLDAAFLAPIRNHLLPSGLPEIAVALFQMTFAIITPALIIGAFTERVRFSFVILFSALWLVVVYLPVAHWVWGGGWLAAYGTIDFAGGIVVHTTAGISALVAAILVGPRDGFPQRLEPPHSPGITMAGAGMLWVGWFGFNGGSALAADISAVSAILATHFAAAAAGLTWMAVERVRLGKPTSVGIVTGCVAGLATITPASGYVGPLGATVIGAVGGFLCFFATGFVKSRLRIDDSLDVFAVHGVGGMLGSLLVALFALPALGGIGFGHTISVGGQFGAQVLGVAATAAWSALCTLALVKLLDMTIGIRVSVEEQREGLDLSTHGERAYDLV
ncbi:MAG TPA: ammonium transporter [Stellaceae bacterium]|jgi:Amt family ammonium transporter|nr:ammonium transporter [Stellaceae bacterium]